MPPAVDTPRPHRRRLLRALGVAVLLLVAGLAVYLAPALPVLARWAAWPVAPSAPITVLVAGVSPKYSGYHTRAPEDFTGLTDTMILAQINPAQGALKLVSLPRDTRVRLPDWGWSKLNSALGRLGVEGMLAEARDLTGVPVSHYLLASLDAAREIVDALGGIRVYVPIEMKYTDTAAKLNINLSPGWHLLDGAAAEGYLRFRKDANGSDINRVQRQQAFFRALVAKLREPASLLKLPAIARVVNERTRTNLTRAEAGPAAGFLLGRPRTDTLLLPGSYAYIGGVSYWRPDPAGVEALAAAHLRGKSPPARDPGTLSIAVVNASGVQGAARKVRDALRAAGYRNAWVGENASGDPTRTVVMSPASLEEARLVAAAVGMKEARVSGEGVLGADLTVRVGTDLAAPKP